MRNTAWRTLPLLVGLCGCDFFQSPTPAVPTGRTYRPPVVPAPTKPPVVKPASKSRYMGKSPEDWSLALSSSELETVRQAATALRVLGAEGRPYLIQGLDNTVPETRRLCLDNLTVSDLRALGDEGRKLLVRLAGDRADLRIRERAARFLSEWDRAVPSP